jgi:hypothetical protein
MVTCISGMEAASSVKLRLSSLGLVLLFPAENLKENLRLLGDAGVCGDSGGGLDSLPPSSSYMERDANSLANAIADSRVRWSAADIGFT